jgi:macrolide transport system ATP-binding/permease protein
MKLLARRIPKDMAANMPFLEGVGLNAHTGAFAAALALIASLLVAATPALRLSFQKVRDGLADGDRGAASRFWRRLGANLVVAELAIAVVLLAGAGERQNRTMRMAMRRFTQLTNASARSCRI